MEYENYQRDSLFMKCNVSLWLAVLFFKLTGDGALIITICSLQDLAIGVSDRH